MNRPGIQTTEFWITAFVNIAGAIISILAARGLVSAEEGELWVALVRALVVAVVPIVMAIVSAAYVESRTRVKEAVARNGGAS